MAAELPDRVHGLAERVLSGDARALSRAITLVENDRPGATELLDRLPEYL